MNGIDKGIFVDGCVGWVRAPNVNEGVVIVCGFCKDFLDPGGVIIMIAAGVGSNATGTRGNCYNSAVTQSPDSDGGGGGIVCVMPAL